MKEKLTPEAKAYIVKERNKDSPLSYEKIAVYLGKEYQITISKQAIQKWFTHSFEAEMRNGDHLKNGKVDKLTETVDDFPEEISPRLSKLVGIIPDPDLKTRKLPTEDKERVRKILLQIARNRGTKKDDVDFLFTIFLDYL